MDRLTYRLIAARTPPRSGCGTPGLLRRLSEAGELDGGRILSVDAPPSAATRLLEAAVPADRLFTFPARSWTGPVGPDIPVFLADREREVEVTAAGGLVRMTPLLRRLRMADGLFAGMPGRCALLHVADGGHAAAVLRGARGLLAAQRPLVLLGVPGAAGPERLGWLEAAVDALAGHDYALVDSVLLPADTAEFRREAVLVGAETGFLAIPRERDRDGLVRRLLGRGLALPEALHGDELLAAGLLRAAALQPDPDGDADLIAFDDALVCDGFHPAESDGERCWRWSGPFPEARAYLPLRRAGAFAFELEILGVAAPALTGALRLYVDGAAVATRMRPHDGGWLATGGFAVPPDRFKGWCELRLAYGATAEPSPAEPRRLGVRIGRCRLAIAAATG